MDSSTELALVRELRYVDGLTCGAVAARIGRSDRYVQRLAPGRPGKIDNTLIREAFLRSGCSAHEVARDLDWYGGGKLDGTRVKQTLGLVETVGGHGQRYRQYRRLIDAETASLIAEAIGVAPWEVGCRDD
jgi:hypothetical protein